MSQLTSDEDIFFLEEQEAEIADFQARGPILDLGGGGEGVIGRIKHEQVVAIDLSRDELQQAPTGPLKLVMDAHELAFPDESFETVTAFFSMMFIDPAWHAFVFIEAFRVLKPRGRFLLWDVHLPSRKGVDKRLVAFMLSARLPHEIIKTGYGTRHWPVEGRSAKYYKNLALTTGFKFSDLRQNGRVISSAMRKPDRARHNPG